MLDRAERERLLARLRADAARIAGYFGLEYRAIEAESPRVKARYGVCYEDGLIKIRLHNVRTGRPLKYSSMIDTLCHELAHLRHFNHGPQFKAFFLELLGWARAEGIYRPDQRRARKLHRGRQRIAAAQQGNRPGRRNGVAVFGASTIDASNLWERLAERAGVAEETVRPAPPPPPEARAAPVRAPAKRRPRRSARDVQYPLFAEAAASSSPAPRRSRRPAGTRPASEPSARKSQLSLFDA